MKPIMHLLENKAALRRLKMAILKFSLMYLINNVHVAASRIQLPISLKPVASSNLFIHRLGFRGIEKSLVPHQL